MGRNMIWQDQLKGNSISWLLEKEDPGVRYLALRDLMDLPADDPELQAACHQAHTLGPISTILEAMDPHGFWEKPGPGYLPKYRSSVWSLILLAQLGASAGFDERIDRACRYMLENALTSYGQFSSSGAPGGTVDCLQGNLIVSMLDMGFSDLALEKAFDWMARSVTGEGVAPFKDKQTPIRYYSGKIGPDFACGANNKLPCAWGAVKVMLAFGSMTVQDRTPLVNRAIDRGVNFLLGIDPANANYPSGWSDKPSGNWWKFGFPVFYVTDLLQVVEALSSLGYGQDPRLVNALSIVLQKQDAKGCWNLEYGYSGKTWYDFGCKKQANKWVTLRALRALKNSHMDV